MESSVKAHLGSENSGRFLLSVITDSPQPEWDNRWVNFDELANEHKDAVYRQMIRVCGNREDAEDVLIEALLKAYRNLDQLRESKAFRGWLAQIARRVCWQLKQRDSLQPLMQLSAYEEEGGQIVDPTDSPELLLAKAQMKDWLTKAVESLEPEYREVYVLRELEEVPGEEVAGRLGISLAAMKSRLHRSRESIRKYLDALLLEKNIGV
jgi:RNA polymerase sigma-70 factor, ECF subfamily